MTSRRPPAIGDSVLTRSSLKTTRRALITGVSRMALAGAAVGPAAMAGGCAKPVQEPWSDGTFWSDGTGWVDDRPLWF